MPETPTTPTTPTTPPLDSFTGAGTTIGFYFGPARRSFWRSGRRSC